MILESDERPPDPACPTCGTQLSYVDTEVFSGAFRTQAASMPQIPVHYYDCTGCQTQAASITPCSQAAAIWSGGMFMIVTSVSAIPSCWSAPISE